MEPLIAPKNLVKNEPASEAMSWTAEQVDLKIVLVASPRPVRTAWWKGPKPSKSCLTPCPTAVTVEPPLAKLLIVIPKRVPEPYKKLLCPAS